ncbi:MAG: SAF domain-containing protein [Actinomycetota bacterium]
MATQAVSDPVATTTDPLRPERTIGRRAALPSGRAVVGALLVTIAVVGLFAAYRQSQRETGVPHVVVARTVAAGDVIGRGDLAVRMLDLGEIADRTFTDPTQAIGSVAVQTLLPGQLLQEANVLEPGVGTTGADVGTFEISFAIDRSRALGGALVPGEVVDIVATVDDGGPSCATVVVPKARIVSVGSGDQEVLSSRNDFAVTLAVDSDQSVLGLIYAVDEADITVVRSTRAQNDAIAGAFCGDTALTGTRPAS